MYIEVTTADITTLKVDGIVNAANSSLLGGGGVDGAIHRAAGPELLAYCRTLNGCNTGEAKVTPGFSLPARRVIHTVGPIFTPGNQEQAQLLKRCYLASLEIAEVEALSSIAFPAISTGVYGYPKDQACAIAVAAVSSWQGEYPQRVLFCCFDSETEAHYNHEISLVGVSSL